MDSLQSNEQFLKGLNLQDIEAMGRIFIHALVRESQRRGRAMSLPALPASLIGNYTQMS